LAATISDAGKQVFEEGRRVALALARRDPAYARIQWLTIWGERAASTALGSAFAIRKSSIIALSVSIDDSLNGVEQAPTATPSAPSFEERYCSQWTDGEMLDWTEPVPTDIHFCDGFKAGMIEAYARDLF
jgi:hypothetical protein